MLHPFERKHLRFSQRLLPNRPAVVVAVSGGPDSAALAGVLAGLADLLELPTLGLAHYDHGLRSRAESDRDLETVRELAERLALPLEVGQADPVRLQALARELGSLEAAARRLRYAFLGEAAVRAGCQGLAVGHTRDDQLETILFRLGRGGSLASLAGIPARRRLSRQASTVSVVRPLLRTRRAELAPYLTARQLPWREDPTNREPRFARNRIRHTLLPAWRESGGTKSERGLLRLAADARQAGRFLRQQARALLHEARLDVGPAELAAWRRSVLLSGDATVRRTALHELLARHVPTSRKAVRGLDHLLKVGRGAQVLSGGSLRLDLADDRLTLILLEAPAEPCPSPVLGLPVPGAVADPRAGLAFEATIRAPAPGELSSPDPSPALALLDAERVLGPGVCMGSLTVRRRRPGDRFWPLGAPGTRTLKRFLIDRKVPPLRRGEIPVVTHGDRPVWVVGHRIDERFKLTPTTQSVLEIRAAVVVGAKGR